MRPRRLELEGFTAFREPVTVDFSGADLFVVTGATGAGKTSIVDAMTLALYGCVPRYGNKGLVAPAISQGRNEARVRLDFSLGTATYSAVRVLRRRKGGGATTREATLERDGEVLARNERELSAKVESLLGLSYDHFVKCVVLPQGDFAQFLHDKPGDRQQLLVELLDIGVYEHMGRLAREREKLALSSAAALASRLDALAEATPAAHGAARSRARRLTRLVGALDEAAPRLAELAAAALEATQQGDRSSAQVAVLEGVVVPEGTAELGRALAGAENQLDRAGEAEGAAADDSTRCAAAVRALPARAELELAERAHADAAEQRDRRARGGRALGERRDEEAAAARRVAEAGAEVSERRRLLELAQARHRAQAVAADLVAGAPCPVCDQLVTEVPQVAVPAGLDEAGAVLRAAESAAEQATAAHAGARRERERVELALESVGERLAELEVHLSAHPDPSALRRRLAEVHEAETALDRAGTAERQAREARTRAQAALEAEWARQGAARAGYDAVRDRVSALGPPPRGGELVADWAALARWASDEAAGQCRAAAGAVERAATLERTRAGLAAGLDQQADALGVVADGRPRRDAVVEAMARAEHEVARLGAARAEADAVRSERAALDEQVAVARELARHLSAKGFEKWLLDEALGLLVEGATALLWDLSDGQYSLALDERSPNFAVIDHRNADERRPARTLSGGETFLASLALAVALADQLALLAARGAPRLESIFLDEGFGTLDPETLEVVAEALETLGRRGRMVGLISHVPALAERLPVRFVVTKQAGAASIRRIDR